MHPGLTKLAHAPQRFNNCMQLLSCICNILAIFIAELREAAAIIDLISDIVYCTYVLCLRVLCLRPHPAHSSLLNDSVQACMQSQTHHELKLHPSANDYGAIVKQP